MGRSSAFFTSSRELEAVLTFLHGRVPEMAGYGASDTLAAVLLPL
jgi:hypothetical protein